MIKLELTGLLYSNKNLDLEYKLHRKCYSKSMNLILTMNFVDLTIKTMQFKPQIIFCDMKTIDLSSSNIKMLLENEEFKNNKIVFIGEECHKKMLENLELSRFEFVFENDIDEYLICNDKVLKFKALENQLEIENTSDLSNVISQTLFSLGFTPKHTGYSYLKDIIKNVILSDGVCASLVGDQYPIIAVKFKTTPSNIERNIRNAISFAYKTLGSDRWSEMFKEYIFLDIDKKPTNREFICMCADKIMAEQCLLSRKRSYVS